MSGTLPIRKGDTVVVLSGKEKGKRGKVVSVHLKPGHPMAPQGGRIERESPITLSNLMLVCPKCNVPTRPSYKLLESGTRIRVCRSPKCKEHID